MDDDVDEVPDIYIFKAAAKVFGKIDNVKDGVLPFSNFVELVETLGMGG